MTIKDERFSDIYDSFKTSYPHDPIERERTPTGFNDYLKLNTSVPVSISTNTISWRSDIQSFSPPTIEPARLQLSEEDENDDPLFLKTKSGTTSVALSESAEQQNSELMMHHRIIDQELKPLHSDLGLNVIFADLYLNAIHILCSEYTELFNLSTRLTRLSEPGEDRSLTVYKMLRLFAMSSQPPFNTKSIERWRPTLHLELFFVNLLDPQERIRAPRIRLKYYTEGETLSADRYAVMATTFFQVKKESYDNCGIQTPVSSDLAW